MDSKSIWHNTQCGCRGFEPHWEHVFFFSLFLSIIACLFSPCLLHPSYSRKLVVVIFLVCMRVDHQGEAVERVCGFQTRLRIFENGAGIGKAWRQISLVILRTMEG